MEKYQTIILTLSDGHEEMEVKATVPAFCEVDDYLRIVGVKVTEPKEMPEGHSWSTMKAEKDK